MRLQRAPRPHRQWLEVGPGKGYSYSNVQSALDAIATAGDAAEDNPYLITVAPGLYDLGSTPINHNVSHTAVIGAGPRSCKIVKTAAGADPAPAAYNLGVGAAGSPGITRNVTISGLCIMNRMAGGSGTGSPPEPALGVGKTADNTQAWDDIHIENCHIIGNHDALQIFGYTTTRGKMWVRSNFIACCHDAFTLKTTGEIFSSGNQIYSNDAGLAALAGSGFTLDKWKTTGIHFGVGTGVTIPIDPLLDKFVSVGDSIAIRASGQSVGTGSGPTQNWATGVLWYGGSQPVYPSRFVGLSIDVRYAETVLTAPTVGGVIMGVATQAATDGLVLFQGGQIHVDQTSVGGTAPTSVSCVRNEGGASTQRWIRLAGTILGGRNANGTCFGLETTNANSRITATVYTTLTHNAAAGVITTPWP